jgi:hypothetical protein
MAKPASVDDLIEIIRDYGRHGSGVPKEEQKAAALLTQAELGLSKKHSDTKIAEVFGKWLSVLRTMNG